MTVYRRAWTMQLKDGAEAAYDTAHAEVWPDLTAQMTADGICRFFLFRSGLTVFAMQERLGPFREAGLRPSALTEKWWQMMSDLMVTDAAGRPVRTDLKEVFALETAPLQTETFR